MKLLLVLRIIIGISVISASVTSDSMNDLLKKGDMVIALKNGIAGEYNRYDVVIFKSPVEDNQLYIKRIIGLPEENIIIKNGKTFVDGSNVPIEEDYLPDIWQVDNDGYEFCVPKDAYLLLGDNRNNSEDARYWAEIALKYGKVETLDKAEKFQYVHRSDVYAKMIFKLPFALDK